MEPYPDAMTLHRRGTALSLEGIVFHIRHPDPGLAPGRQAPHLSGLQNQQGLGPGKS